jgi:hypothetical protein
MKAGWKAKPGEEVIVAAHDPPEQFSSLALEQYISSSLATTIISAAASLWTCISAAASLQQYQLQPHFRPVYQEQPRYSNNISCSSL